MQVIFWGTRGSVPTRPDPASVRRMLERVVRRALEERPVSDEDIEALVREATVEGARPYASNTPCVEVRAGSDFLVFDAGSGIRELGMDLLERPDDGGPIHLFLSHLHWDHVQGFPFFAPVWTAGREIHVWGCHDDVERALRAQMEPPFFPVPLDAMAADVRFHRLSPDEPVEVDGFTVSAYRQVHPGVSYGYAVEAEGRKVVYSTDAEHGDEAFESAYPYLDFIRGADLLIFDAAYSLADQLVSKRDWGHSSNVLGVELAGGAGVRHLVLFHHDPTVDDDELEQLLKATRRYASLCVDADGLKVDVAHDGMVVEL